MVTSGADPGFKFRGGAHLKLVAESSKAKHFWHILQVFNENLTFFFGHFGGGGKEGADAPPSGSAPAHNCSAYKKMGNKHHHAFYRVEI